MPITFLKNKKYVVISHENRVAYYQNLKDEQSLNLDIVTLSELREMSSKENFANFFMAKEIIISGYYTNGDEIAHYINSISNNMAIGYELEEEAINDSFNARYCHSAIKGENEAISLALKYHETNHEENVYFLSLDHDFGKSVGDMYAFIKILNGYVCPLDGHFIILNFHNDKKLSKEDETALETSLKSSKLIALFSVNHD